MKIVGTIFEKMKIIFFLMWTTHNFEGRSKTKNQTGDICKETPDIEFEQDWSVGLGHGCANHDTERKHFKFPHPLLWRNEASLPDQRRTMYFPLALFAYTVCCRHTEQCFTVLRTHKSDAVDGSSGRRYVTDQSHNVPLLRARGLGATLGDGQKIKNYFSSFRDFSGKSRYIVSYCWAWNVL